jgi:pilus assembly protein Flp/PilA
MKWKLKSKYLHKLLSQQSGQGIVEYALILVLVSIVVILGLTVFGEQTRDTYCDIVYSLDSSASPPGCADTGQEDDEDSLVISCSGLNNGATVNGNVTLEGVVTDNAGANNVTNVRFYIDGGLYRTEAQARYCLGSGDSSCGPYNTNALSNGNHTFRAIAADADGNSASCEVTVNVQN